MLSWLGLTKWAGFGTLAMAFIVGCSAFGVWLRDDAVNACNAGWELKLGAAAQKAAAENKVLNDKLSEASLKIQGAEAKASNAELTAEQALEKQREQTPLTNACDLCRVPNGYLWVRESTDGATPASSVPGPASSSSTPISKAKHKAPSLP
jgi:hypothetical protein